MAIETITSFEQKDIPQSFVELAETVAVNPDEQVIEEVLEDWRENPGEHIKNQIEELAELYRDRSDRQLFSWSGHTEEITIFATRDNNEQNIEEIYHIIDKFSSATKQWQSRSYGVTMLEDDGRAVLLTISMDGDVRVHESSAKGKTELLFGEAADDAVVDFFSRSLVSTVRNCRRSDEGKELANSDAKQKLEKFIYDGPKVVTSID